MNKIVSYDQHTGKKIKLQGQSGHIVGNLEKLSEFSPVYVWFYVLGEIKM